MRPSSTPPATSNPPTATPTTGPSAPPASIFTSPPSLVKRQWMTAGQKSGCIIVDSTRRGKRFPDSMSKTIPIWACVMNRAISRVLSSMSDLSDEQNWDCSLHLPLWVPETEKAAIEAHLDEWTSQLEATGVDLTSLALSLRKPLRPLWISQKSLIWLNEVPDHDSWDFTPIILVSASISNDQPQQRTASEFSWRYISGAGDDEESWARGLTPSLFWKNAFELISSGPDLCNKKVSVIVENDRVYRSQRGEHTVQVKLKSFTTSANNVDTSEQFHQALCSSMNNGHSSTEAPGQYIGEASSIYWIHSTNIAVGMTQHDINVVEGVDAILNCDSEVSSSSSSSSNYLHLPIVTSKFDRFSLLKCLPSAVNFANSNLSKGKTVLVCCCTGEDISICVSLAILTSLFNDRGDFDGGRTFRDVCITKWEVRRRLVFICKYALNARPSRGNLRQVYNFLIREKTLPSVVDVDGDDAINMK
ncbi:tRNA A64-2'-O-ribosylphosphate transferase isoform X2 [Nymphaea colorata]|nr:tRNA A64-2'-O-ribosylphosphate transferase isoform X2 [Nymphaea colorata]